jgi:hypothetical protein
VNARGCVGKRNVSSLSLQTVRTSETFSREWHRFGSEGGLARAWLPDDYEYRDERFHN